MQMDHIENEFDAGISSIGNITYDNNDNVSDTSVYMEDILAETDLSIQIDTMMCDGDDENDDDDDDDDNSSVFITRFPSPDALISYGWGYNVDDESDTMSDTSDDSLFSDLSDSFSLLRLDIDMEIVDVPTPSPPILSKASRVTKVRARMGGWWNRDACQTRRQRAQHGTEHKGLLRAFKSKLLAETSKPSMKDTLFRVETRSTFANKKSTRMMTGLASTVRMLSPRKIKLPRTMERALVGLTMGQGPTASIDNEVSDTLMCVAHASHLGYGRTLYEHDVTAARSDAF
ncbi:uncharacterized protein SPSK_04493 [Sporothrix schenckii 1099-18]|uniref:Uncharacterized protein n=1 Tax=Sporothrix schenckii 1099-18 TaxID=1397361 RepID=A0A0F2M016_SPOSC|nr:uncharacterized protein SPSK_04493 [Sporothrix schenckii 1099-18]KJR83053.1 hypothetical protein SPSK_04493 [Sporothrix schenckii 1099-18]